MAERAPLRDVPVGSTLLLPCRLTAKGPAGVTLDTIAADFTTTGTIQIASGGAISGSFTIDPRDQPVRVVAFALRVGDVVRNTDNGQVLVVQAVGLGPDGGQWSPSTAQRPLFPGEGWTVVGHIDLAP